MSLTLSDEKFNLLHEKFLDHVKLKSHEQGILPPDDEFRDFNNKYLQNKEIIAKQRIVQNATKILELEKWDEWKNQPGLIFKAIQESCHYKISAFLLTGERWGEGSGPTGLFKKIPENKISEFESTIYSFFKGKDSFEQRFKNLIEYLKKNNLPKNSQLLGYLSFLVDPEKYFGIRKTSFQDLLRYFGYNEKIGGPSWEQYALFLNLAHATQDKLSKLYPKPNMIETHSYMWEVAPLIPFISAKKTNSGGMDFSTNKLILDKIITALKIKKQVILYGPPGTGKTYYSTQLLPKIFLEQNKPKISICYASNQGIQKIENFQKLIQQNEKILWGVNWKVAKEQKAEFSFPIKGYVYFQGNIIAIANITNITEHKNTSESDKALRPQGLGYDEDYETYLHVDYFEIPIPFSHKKLELYDKSKTIQDVIQQHVYVDELDHFQKFVTFHPSYSYEDFVEGIRPVTKNGAISYELQDGIFKKICKDAQNDLDNDYLLIIDEINRGNISKIFGELITLIEDDKREKHSLYLAYSKKSFSVPKNLYILGTMNTADKSLVQIDTALRRRFAFVELMPNYDLPELELKIDVKIEEKFVQKSLKELLYKLNTQIRKRNIRDKQIGHSYFLKIKNMTDLQFVFRYEIIPLFQDYFYDNYETLADILGNKIISKSTMSIDEDVISDPDKFSSALGYILSKND